MPRPRMMQVLALATFPLPMIFFGCESGPADLFPLQGRERAASSAGGGAQLGLRACMSEREGYWVLRFGS